MDELAAEMTPLTHRCVRGAPCEKVRMARKDGVPIILLHDVDSCPCDGLEESHRGCGGVGPIAPRVRCWIREGRACHWCLPRGACLKNNAQRIPWEPWDGSLALTSRVWQYERRVESRDFHRRRIGTSGADLPCTPYPKTHVPNPQRSRHVEPSGSEITRCVRVSLVLTY